MSTEPEPGKCGAEKRQEPYGYCGLPAGWGTDHPGIGKCRKHGGNTRNHRRAAKREEAEGEAQRMVALAGVDQDPIEHLLESLHLAACLVRVWGEMVAELDQAQRDDPKAELVRGGLGYTEDTDSKSPYELEVISRDRLLALNRHGEAGVHPFVTEYENALDRRAKFAKLCIDAGVAERQVQLAEKQGAMLALAIKGILADLGVADRPEVPGVVRRHLTLVARSG
jgi:hypothetical protein